jgi:hypothetical protein
MKNWGSPTRITDFYFYDLGGRVSDFITSPRTNVAIGDPTFMIKYIKLCEIIRDVDQIDFLKFEFEWGLRHHMYNLLWEVVEL